MTNRRLYASSVLNTDGDIWVIGGVAKNRGNDSDKADSTEVYQYRPNGKGKWTISIPLPRDYRDTGIERHCTVR